MIRHISILNQGEQDLAKWAAAKRRREMEDVPESNPIPADKALEYEERGILGELAYCKYRHIWPSGLFTPKARDNPECEVRTVGGRHHGLYTKKGDEANFPAVLVLPVLRDEQRLNDDFDPARWEIIGWAFPKDIYGVQEFWNTRMERPGYVMPRRHLRPMSELWAMIEREDL